MIKFKNIDISYGDFKAIENLSLDIKEGEFFTFLGPSGCGKTTTLRSLVGFLNPSSGTIELNGKDVTNLPVEKREIGMVFQSYALFPTMTVYENIAFGLKVKKLSKEEIDKKVRNVAKTIEITEEQLFKNVSQLSGGQQQRVALARTIVLEPKILCLDEPLSNLDAKLRIGLREELKKLQKTLGITTLYVTHDQDEALTLSDRIAVFNKGKIEQVGTPFEIYNHSSTKFVCDFIGDINKLQKEVLVKLNEFDSSIDIEKKSYLRIERVLFEKAENTVEFDCTIESNEYNGVITKYYVSVLGQKMNIYRLNDGSKLIKNGTEIKIYINPNDVMQF